MKGLFSYMILPDYHLIINIYHGDLVLDDIKQAIKDFTSDPRFTHDLNIISDLRHCNLNIHPNELPDFVNFLKTEFKEINNRKEAVLTDRPNEVVISMLYSIQSHTMPIRIEVFTTIRSALKYLFVDRTSYPLIKKQIVDLKKNLL